MADVERQLAEVGADTVTEALRADIAAQLEAGHDVAYTALASHAGFAAGRVAGGEDEVEGGLVVVGEDQAVGAQFVATKDGFAVHSASATPEGITESVAAGVVDDDEEDEDSAGVSG